MAKTSDTANRPTPEELIVMADSTVTEGENIALQPLFANPAFARFYAENRPNIPIRVYWLPDQTLQPKEYRCVHHQFADMPECAIIHLQHFPVLASEAQSIAHELTHILLDFEGYPQVTTKRTANANEMLLPMALSSLFSDLVIDRWLMDEYRLIPPLERHTQISRITDQIKDVPLPKHPILYAHWAVNCLDMVLEREVMTGDTSPHPLYLWLAERHPKLIQDINWALGMTRAIGYETPEQQERLLKGIIKRFGLERYGIHLWTEKQRTKIRARHAARNSIPTIRQTPIITQQPL